MTFPPGRGPTSSVTNAETNPPAAKTRVLFRRDLRYFSGGHQKVHDYFMHVVRSDAFSARISFSPETVWGEMNPWRDWRERAVDWDPRQADVLFLAGMDWEFALEHGAEGSGRPIVNLIQHVRHADPGEPLHRFLTRRAIRICVSGEVADAILATGRVRGPVFTIPNAIEQPLMPEPTDERGPRQPVLVLGTKRTEFARRLWQRLRESGVDARLHDRFVPRAEFLGLLAAHPTTVCCPDPTEGFYLPALEAMSRGSLVICPDCVGNRSFCLDRATCLVPPYDLAGMAESVTTALQLGEREFAAIRRAGRRLAALHSPAAERERFLDILQRVEPLWRD